MPKVIKRQCPIRREECILVSFVGMYFALEIFSTKEGMFVDLPGFGTIGRAKCCKGWKRAITEIEAEYRLTLKDVTDQPEGNSIINLLPKDFNPETLTKIFVVEKLI